MNDALNLRNNLAGGNITAKIAKKIFAGKILNQLFSLIWLHSYSSRHWMWQFVSLEPFMLVVILDVVATMCFSQKSALNAATDNTRRYDPEFAWGKAQDVEPFTVVSYLLLPQTFWFIFVMLPSSLQDDTRSQQAQLNILLKWFKPHIHCIVLFGTKSNSVAHGMARLVTQCTSLFRMRNKCVDFLRQTQSWKSKQTQTLTKTAGDKVLQGKYFGEETKEKTQNKPRAYKLRPDTNEMLKNSSRS